MLLLALPRMLPPLILALVEAGDELRALRVVERDSGQALPGLARLAHAAWECVRLPLRDESRTERAEARRKFSSKIRVADCRER